MASMVKIYFFAALSVLFASESLATNLSNAYLYDYQENGITSQISGSKRALDVGIDVAGIQIDPRSRSWSLLSTSDSVSAVQSGAWTISVGNFPSVFGSTQSGSWSVGRTWNLSSASDSVNVGNFPSTQTVSGSVSVSNFPATQPISVATLPLPSGAATASNQTTANASLSTIASNTSGLALESGGNLAGINSKLSGTITVDASGHTVPVTGNFYQAVQPVSQSGTFTTARSWNLSSANDSVSVTGSITTTNASIGATASPLPGSATLVGGSDGTNLRALKVSSAGVLSVDGSGVTQPVSGTVAVSSLGAGSNTIGNVNVNGTVPVSGTFWQSTQPISAASLPLPSGAATSAKQPGLGTSGTASNDVITVQGISGMTALKVDGSSVTQPISATSLPLPSGAATASNQTTANTTLSTISSQLPSSLGSKTSSTSMSVVVASDQTLPTKAPVNANASLSARATVTTSESTISAPSNSVGVVVECESVNADNIRWGFSNGTTTILSSTLGMLCEPGRDSGFMPIGAGTVLHLISTGSGSDYADVQWVMSQ